MRFWRLIAMATHALISAAASPHPPSRHRRTALAEARRPEAVAVETRLVDLRQEQERQAAERYAVQSLAQEKAELEDRYTALEERCHQLEAEQRRLSRMLSETETQRDLYQLSASAAEDRVRDLQLEYETAPMMRGSDKRFDQLRRFLARELHPDLARADTPERAVREALFKRVWAKIEQLQ
jgi:chromosome segregation ATPase